MASKNRRPILVTGSHRSGTTWAGRMLSASTEIAYVYEPFNIARRPGLPSLDLTHWFTYICDENEGAHVDAVRDCLQFNYNLRREARRVKSYKDVLRLLYYAGQFKTYAVLKKRPLLKDPIAIFSAEWLAGRFDMEVVVLVRHPAAFAGSLKKANWRHPFGDFLKQPLLLERCLEGYASQIEDCFRAEREILGQAILLWNMIHQRIAEYREMHPDWIFVKHEVLSRNPIEEFARIYDRLGIGFTPRVEGKIRASSFADARNGKGGLIKRDSRSNISTWKQRLTEEEIRIVKRGTQDVAKAFYTEDDWVT